MKYSIEHSEWIDIQECENDEEVLRLYAHPDDEDDFVEVYEIDDDYRHIRQV